MVKKSLARIYIFLVLLIMYAPMLILFVFSFSTSYSIGNFDNGFSFQVYADLFNGNYTERISEALINTLLIGFVASTFALVLGTTAAIGISNMKKRPRAIFSTLSKIPMINAEIVTALCFLMLFAIIGISNLSGFGDYLGVILAHTTLCTPYVLLSVLPKLQQMNKFTYEAAIDLGATPMQALTKVILPEIAPGMVSGFILAFTISVDDFVVTQFTKGSFDTLSTFIYTASVKKPLPPELRALSVIILVVVLAVLFFINKQSSKSSKKNLETN